MTDVIDTGEIATAATDRPDTTARIYLPDPPPTEVLFTAPRLPFYDNGGSLLRHDEPPILDVRPAATKLVDRPASLADLAPALAEVLTEPAAEHPIVPAVARARRDGDPGRHRAADPAWLWWMVAVGAPLAVLSATALIVLAVIR